VNITLRFNTDVITCYGSKPQIRTTEKTQRWRGEGWNEEDLVIKGITYTMERLMGVWFGCL
jgi:hypothetical protein